MGKTQAEKDAAKQAAKAAVAERKAVHAAALDTPLAGDEAAEAGQTVGVGTTAAQESGQAGGPAGEPNADAGAITQTATESADSVASLAAEGLRDGGSLSDDEVQRVSGAALAASGSVLEASGSVLEVGKVDDAKTAALIAALTERVEQAEILIGKLESKIADLEKKLYKIGKDARITVKDDSTLHGKIDDLRM